MIVIAIRQLAEKQSLSENTGLPRAKALAMTDPRRLSRRRIYPEHNRGTPRNDK